MEKYPKYRTHSEFQTIEIHQGEERRKNTGIFFSAHHFPIGLEATVALSSIFDGNGHLCFSAPAFQSTWLTVKFS
jgi:hypothetical protein